MILSPTSLLAFVAFATTLFSARKDRDIFSPIRLYILTYSFTLAITCLRLSPYSENFMGLFWIVLGTCGLAYVLGAASIELIFHAHNRPPLPMQNIKETLVNESHTPDTKRTLVGILISLAIFVVVFFWGSKAIGSIPVFAEYPDQARQDLAFFGSAANFLCMGEAAVILCTALLFTKPTRYKWSIRLALAIGLIFSIGLLSRYTMMKMLFICLVAYRYLVGPIKAKIVVSVILAFVLIVVGAFVLRSSGDFIEQEEYKQYQQLRVKKGYEVFALPYAYLANNYWNLNYGFELNESQAFRQTYGAKTFHALFQLVRQGKNIDKALDIESFLDLEIQKVKPFNTIPYHWYLFRDFGFFGMVMGSFVGGLLIAFTYMKLRTTPSWPYLLLYATAAFFIALSFFASPWYHLPTWIVLAGILLILKYSTKQTPLEGSQNAAAAS